VILIIQNAINSIKLNAIDSRHAKNNMFNGNPQIKMHGKVGLDSCFACAGVTNYRTSLPLSVFDLELHLRSIKR
jgi:hypothetical protein